MFIVINNINRVQDNLYFGGAPDNQEAKKYKYVFNVSTHASHYAAKGMWVTCFPFDDVDDINALPGASDLHDLAKLVLQRSKQGPTLVHCSAGLNRSGLVTALALMHDGMTADRAISHLRRVRCDDVLSTPAFCTFLRSADVTSS